MRPFWSSPRYQKIGRFKANYSKFLSSNLTLRKFYIHVPKEYCRFKNRQNSILKAIIKFYFRKKLLIFNENFLFCFNLPQTDQVCKCTVLKNAFDSGIQGGKNIFYSNAAWELAVHTNYGTLQNEKFSNLELYFLVKNWG